MSATGRLLAAELGRFPGLILSSFSSFVPRPLEASFFVTRKCNSRCCMCDYWKESPGDQSELSTAEIIALYDQLKDLGVIVLSLSGEGEMTLRTDFPILLKEAAKRNFMFSVNSNFLHLSDENALAIVEAKPYQVTIGIDTLVPDRYSMIRGIPNGVSRVQSNIEKLLKLGFDNIALGAVVLDSNINDLAGLVHYAATKHLAGVRFTAFQPYGFGKRWEPKQLAVYTHPDFQRSLRARINELISLKRSGLPVLTSEDYLRMIPDSYTPQPFFPVACRAPIRRIHVHPTGKVTLCQVVGKPAEIGSTRERSLHDIWHSPKANTFRKAVKNRACGGCWLSCYAETNLRFSWAHGGGAIANGIQRLVRLRGKRSLNSSNSVSNDKQKSA